VTLPDINAVLKDYLSNRWYLTALLEGTGQPSDGTARPSVLSPTVVH
jgi:hypothetical protein